MKKVLLGTLAVLTLAACSKDEVVQQNPNDAISFSVVTNKAVSRAANGYCNNHMPKNFSVWARVGTVNYFEEEKYVQETGETSKYVIDGGVTRYWPESGKVDFFAAKNYQVAPTWNAATGLKLENFTVINTVSGAADENNVKGSTAAQNDFIYAVVKNAVKKDDGSGYNKTELNFHHGLSQIVFKLKNQNKNIYVKATGVKVMNVKNKGTFTFPTESTAPNVEDADHNNPYDGTASSGAWGTWALTTDLDSYKATFDVVEAKKQDAAYSLTYDNSPGVEYNVNSMYLMPQSFSLADISATNTKLWNGTDALKKDDGSGTKVYDTDCGAYVILTCQIYNIANPNELDTKGGYVDGTDIALWGGTTAKDIAVALPSTAPWKWEQGKKYVYTFVFTPIGNGGTDPDTDKPVFTPIKLEVTVDDFVDETDTELEMVDKP